MIRDHGGGLDAAIARYGGTRPDWVDLSTGINPVPYPVMELSADCWTALPDRAATDRLVAAARAFWKVPEDVALIAAPGASALIARLPEALPPGTVRIPGPTYNEHAAAFQAAGHLLTDDPAAATVVLVHPNNPDGRLWPADAISAADLSIIDESFCDTMPDRSHMARSASGRIIILKSFGKFWGLAGLRLGFAAGEAGLMNRLSEMLGPWAVSGPALAIGAAALADHGWASMTRARLTADAARIDDLMTGHGATLIGGTTLFRLYAVDDAAAWQDRLARCHVWSRIFPYSRTWIRLGLPHPDRWDQVRAAL
jgi:cobalamin biosynthesis protein CobC